jgi:cytochrome c oxidase assembly factor CtaG
MDGAFSLGLFTALLAALSYGAGFRRLRVRGRADARLAALFAAGLAAGLVAVSPPFDRMADESLTAHMLQHLLLGDVMALLLVAGLRGPISVFALPPVILVPLARSRALRALLRVALAPAVSLAAWALVVVSWHVPVVYDFALAHEPVHAFEHVTFVVVGLLVWTQVLAPAGRHQLGPGRRALFALAVLGLGMVLSEVLLVAGPLYPHYADAHKHVFGLSPGEDQQRAGLLMMGEQIATLGTAAALLLWTHVESVAAQLADGPSESA